MPVSRKRYAARTMGSRHRRDARPARVQSCARANVNTDGARAAVELVRGRLAVRHYWMMRQNVGYPEIARAGAQFVFDMKHEIAHVLPDNDAIRF